MKYSDEQVEGKRQSFDEELASLPSNTSLHLFVPWNEQLQDYASKADASSDFGNAETDSIIRKTIEDLRKVGRLYPPSNSRFKTTGNWIIAATCLALFGAALAVILAGSHSQRSKGSAIAISALVVSYVFFGLEYFLKLIAERKAQAYAHERKAAFEKVTDRCNESYLKEKRISVQMSDFGAYLRFTRLSKLPTSTTTLSDNQDPKAIQNQLPLNTYDALEEDIDEPIRNPIQTAPRKLPKNDKTEI